MSIEQEKEKCGYLYNYNWRNEYLTNDAYRNLVAMISINSIAALLSISLNTVIIFAVATRHHLRSNSNILLACLAGTDLLTGLIAQPVSIAIDIERVLGVGTFCSSKSKLADITFGGVCLASLFHLVLVCVDRYVATRHPLRYQEHVTPQRIAFGVLLAWAVTVFRMTVELVFAVIDSESELYSSFLKGKDIVITIIVWVCLAFIVYTYGYIYSETRRQKKRLETEQLSHEEAKRMKKNKKAAFTLAIILGALILAYLPTMIIAVLFASSDITPPVMTILWSWCKTFVLSGSVLNPLIYCWRIKKLRRSFLEILHLRQPQQGLQSDIEMQTLAQPPPQDHSNQPTSSKMDAPRQGPVLPRAGKTVHLEEISEETSD